MNANYKEPANEAEAIVTVNRLIRQYDQITAIATETLKEDNFEWEGDACDLLYSAQTILLGAITRLVHTFELAISVGASKPSSVDGVSTKLPAEPREDSPNSDEAMTTANRLTRHAEALIDIAAVVRQEDQSEFENDAADQIYHAKETLLRAAVDLTLCWDDLAIRIVKRPAKEAS
jgi:hypothetical protein